jgi:hypothetical protein
VTRPIRHQAVVAETATSLCPAILDSWTRGHSQSQLLERKAPPRLPSSNWLPSRASLQLTTLKLCLANRRPKTNRRSNSQQACASGVKREPVPPTRVVSMLFKGDTRALAYRPPITGRLLGISIMTLAELERWSLERNWGQGRNLELAQHRTRYTVLPVSRS